MEEAQIQVARAEIFERYKLAHAEYRAEVALNSSRQLHLLLMGWAPPFLFFFFGNRSYSWILLCVCAFMSACTAMIVRVGHLRYRATRDLMLALENMLGFQDLQTTGGQREARGKPRDEPVRIVRLVELLCWIPVVVDLFLVGIR